MQSHRKGVLVLAVLAQACASTNDQSGSGEGGQGGGGSIGIGAGGNFNHDAAVGGGGGDVKRDAGEPAAPDAAGDSRDTALLEGAFPLARVLSAKPEVFAELDGYPEGPVWKRPDLFVAAKGLQRIASDRSRHHYLDVHVGASYAIDAGVLLVAGQDGLLQISANGSVSVIADGFKANDLTVDGYGNVFVTDPSVSGNGRVLRITPAGTVEVVATGLRYPNGLEVDPQGTFLYVVETEGKRLIRYKLAADGAVLLPAETVVAFDEGGDGCTFDAWGNLWVAIFSKGQVAIVDVVKKKELGRISVGLSPASNLAFGGSQLDELFVTAGSPPGPTRVYRIAVGVAGAAPAAGSLYKSKRPYNKVVTDTAY